jgi:hypothetical protein
MGLGEWLLVPFRTWFRAPRQVDTPFSTIKVPPTQILVTLVFGSFCIITSGFVFCLVRGMPMMGAALDRDGRPFMTWMSGDGVSGQFLAEGIIAAMMFACAAAAFIAAYVILRKPDNELTEFDQYLRYFSFSAPFWCLLSYRIFQAKIGHLSIKFRP